LWILNSSSSKRTLNQDNIPISDKLKNHYNTMMFTNPESTQDTDKFQRVESEEDIKKSLKTPGFRNTQNVQNSTLKTNNQRQGYDKSGHSGTGFRLTFNEQE